MKLFLLTCLFAVACCSTTKDVIPGEYIVMLNPSVVPVSQLSTFADKLRTRFNVDVFYQYESINSLAIRAKYLDPAVLEELPEVKLVEKNQIFRIQQCASRAHPGCWGGDRIDQAGPLTYSEIGAPNGVYSHNPSADGAGVFVYIIDTGIDIGHADFAGRAVRGFTAGNLVPGDNHGHGTHCAGSSGSDPYGMAKACTLVEVKVMNALGFGNTADIIAGVDWATAQGNAPRAVFSMSLGGGGSPGMDAAVQNAIDSGNTCVVAAGNDGGDACDGSPSRLGDAITVGAMAINDECAGFSNTGNCMDIFGPGVNIVSSAAGGGSTVMSGTSMACPHVAGVAARLISQYGLTSPAAVRSRMLADAVNGAISGIPGLPAGTPNVMVQTDC